MANTRQVIVTVVGHVDHGKTSILDRIRNTSVQAGEVGGITQAIGASIIPIETIRKVVGKLLEQLKLNLTIPGLLFIDTPGHAAFTNLRKRGGNLADIAIVVIDINEGAMPQTLETIDILKQYKTPFIIAANKLDLVSGWTEKGLGLVASINAQPQRVKEALDIKLYKIIGKLSELGFQSERFDRVEDYTKQIAIVPCSALTGEGLPELLMMIAGLAQKYLETGLKIIEGPAKGTVLEVKKEKGLGVTMDVIIYDGVLKKNDVIVIGGLEAPVVTKVKALFEPASLADMRDRKSKFKAVDKVRAATGVKISAPDIEEVIAGMPLKVAGGNLGEVKAEIQKEVSEVVIETQTNGVVIKADSLGSLEALARLLNENNITVRTASIGEITRKDISEAESSYDSDPLNAVVLGFNVKPSAEAKNAPETVRVFTSSIIYTLIDEVKGWREEVLKQGQARELNRLVRPCRLEVMKGYVFRQSNPAIVGVDVAAGMIKIDTPIMNAEGKPISTIRSIQHEKESVQKAEKGSQVAVALEKVTVGRQVNEGDTLYAAIPEEDFRKFKELKKYLQPDEIEVLKEVAEIKRKENPVWGI